MTLPQSAIKMPPPLEGFSSRDQLMLTKITSRVLLLACELSSLKYYYYVNYFCVILEAQFICLSNLANLNCIIKPNLCLNSDS